MIYQLIDKDGNIIGSTENLNFVRKVENGCFNLCKREVAEGVAYNGHVYYFHDTSLDNVDIAHIQEVDSADIMENISNIAKITFTNLAESGSLDDATINEHKDVFEKWQENIDYATGRICNYNGTLYRCNEEHTSNTENHPTEEPVETGIKKVTSRTAVTPIWTKIG